MRNTLGIYDHDHLRVNSDEIPVRHMVVFPAGQLQCERAKAILQPLLNLFDKHDMRVSAAFLTFKPLPGKRSNYAFTFHV